MRFESEFYKLPLRFDVSRLVQEISCFAPNEWVPHPSGFRGNWALLLVSANGGDNDETVGPMLPTSFLNRCPYIQQVLSSFKTRLGRSRLMRVDDESNVPEHVDVGHYWHSRVRVHVPILTDPAVRFHCNGQDVHMASGEAWIFDTWRLHKIVNPTSQPRIHLVVDTRGTQAFWSLVDGAQCPCDPRRDGAVEPRFVPYRDPVKVRLQTERDTPPAPMPPDDIGCLVNELVAGLRRSTQLEKTKVDAFVNLIRRFRRHWRIQWTRSGSDRRGWPRYQAILGQPRDEAAAFAGQLRLDYNGMEAYDVLQKTIIHAALSPPPPATDQPANRPTAQPKALRRPKKHILDRPVFIVAAPRSGSTLLFETLANAQDLWTIGGESHAVFERVDQLNPAQRRYDSNRLTEQDADRDTCTKLRGSFVKLLRDWERHLYVERTVNNTLPSVRMLEKTPKNALRIPFLNAAFPDASFIFLHRNPRQSIASIMEAWRSERFVTYPRLPGWQGQPWSLLLIPGWQALIGKSLVQIAAAQWSTANEQILLDLADVPPARWTTLSYEQLLADPREQVKRLCTFIGVHFDKVLATVTAGRLPLSRFTLSPPDPDKWRNDADAIESVIGGVEDLAARLGELEG